MLFLLYDYNTQYVKGGRCPLCCHKC